MTYIHDLIGVDFAYGGRGPDSYDCWGLVMETYKRWHGIELPDYRSSSNPEENAQIMSRESARQWEPTGLVPGSVLMMRVKGLGAHVEFIHSNTRFIQAVERLGVIESRMQQFRIQTIGAYRYVGP